VDKELVERIAEPRSGAAFRGTWIEHAYEYHLVSREGGEW
jgi:hypothetical protein